MTEQKNRLHIYTGNGKGKTTSAVGQSVRAAASGLKVLFVYFNKIKPRTGGEDKILTDLKNVEVKYFAGEHPSFFPGAKKTDMVRETLKGLEFIKNYLKNKKADVTVLDEILISVRDNYVNEEELMEFIGEYLKSSEVILTGRSAGSNLIKKADLVSNITNVKHYYSGGQKSRQGIEI